MQIALAHQWRAQPDPEGIGLDEGWQHGLPASAHPVAVPGYAQQTFPDATELLWFETIVVAPAGDASVRRWLSFESVDYACDVWWDGSALGSHEGAEESFEFDVTEVSVPGNHHRVSVRVFMPGSHGRHGPTMDEVPHRNRRSPYSAGESWLLGGITGKVTVGSFRASRVVDVWVDVNVGAGLLTVHTEVHHASGNAPPMTMALGVQAAGELAVETIGDQHVHVPSGTSHFSVDHPIGGLALWDIDSPNQHRITVDLRDTSGQVMSSASTAFGIRDFRIENDGFQLNGRPIFIKMTHTVNDFPLVWTHRQSLNALREDLIRLKAMGFNMVRFIWGDARPEQLSLCDELGLLVYCESHAAWLVGPGRPLEPPVLEAAASRFLGSLTSVMRRYRRHASIVVWGLLNECIDPEGVAVAAGSLGELRAVDASRVMFLNSGRFDHDLGTGSASNPRSDTWDVFLGDEELGRGVISDGGWTNGWPPRVGRPMGTGDAFGDVHLYARTPHQRADIQELRQGGLAATGNVFLGEYGIGSAVNLWDVVAEFDTIRTQRGSTVTPDEAFYQVLLGRFLEDFDRWELRAVFGHPARFFGASQARMARERIRGMSAVSANRRLIGFGLTGAVDQVMCGEGIVTTFRRRKSGAHDATASMLDPTRLLMFVDREAIYSNEALPIEVWLADERRLAPGAHRGLLEVRSMADNAIVVQEGLDFVFEEHARAVSHSSVVIALPELRNPGAYEVQCLLDNGGVATAGRLVVHVVDQPDLRASRVRLINADTDTRRWLDTLGLRYELADTIPIDRQLPVLTWIEPGTQGRELLDQADAFARSGGNIFVCIRHGASSPADDWDGSEAAGVAFASAIGWLYQRDDWARPHRLTNDLPGIVDGLLDYGVWASVLPDLVIQSSAPADAVVFGGIKASQGYQSGSLLVEMTPGLGRAIYTTLELHGDQTASPVAGLLMRNTVLRLAEGPTSTPRATARA